MYDIVIREFKKSGLTQAQLADRLGKTPDVICRLLSRPGNWESNTFADLMFGISGAVPTFSIQHPLETPASVAPMERSDIRD
jgi:transcriptional regulator with XRE-family HTH domain